MSNQFKKDVESVIKNYEKLFDDNKAMSLDRSTDIIDIRGLLTKSYSHLDNCCQTVGSRLAKIKTGWWFFKTGNSRLRDNIMQVIDNYKQPLVCFLLTKIQDVESQNAEFESRRQQDSKPIQALQTILMEKEKIIRLLQFELKRAKQRLKKISDGQTSTISAKNDLNQLEQTGRKTLNYL